VADRHEVRVWDLHRGDVPICLVDLRNQLPDWKSKESKVSAIAWRADVGKDAGTVVWLGTTEGHLLEFDVRTGAISGVKPGAHPDSVSHIFRYGRAMVSFDVSGKCLVFAPENTLTAGIVGGAIGAGVPLALARPSVVRIAEKQEFAAVLGGQLWTSGRADRDREGAGRGPMVRVTDVLRPGGGAVPRSVLPREHLGTVVCGTALPNGTVYLGHEGGHVSVWDVSGGEDGAGGHPVNTDVVRIGVSDVSCLEAVNDRLWAGGRKGAVEVFDIGQKPWVLTNAWVAHRDAPVQKIMVDAYSVERVGKLLVTSVGRDERIRFWDGLLGVEWVGESTSTDSIRLGKRNGRLMGNAENELIKREEEFASFRTLRVLIFSWNVDAAKPAELEPAEAGVFGAVVHAAGNPDIVSFGLQEVVDLESRRMLAKNLAMGSRRSNKGGTAEVNVSERVTGAYKRWYDRLNEVMRDVGPYTLVACDHLVGMFSAVFVKTAEIGNVGDAQVKLVKRGMGGRYGNKVLPFLFAIFAGLCAMYREGS
jgi:hypothetical protein